MSTLRAITRRRIGVLAFCCFLEFVLTANAFGQSNPVGTEFRVNTYTTNSQEYSSVALLPGAGFVVTWASYGQDGSGSGIYGQVFDSDGTKVGSEFRVNTSNTSGFQTTSVIGLPAGGFVVTWDAYTQAGSTWN